MRDSILRSLFTLLGMNEKLLTSLRGVFSGAFLGFFLAILCFRDISQGLFL